MAMIRFITILLASAALPTGAALSAQDTLRVLWHSPSDSTGPSSVVTVMFDRPVALALDSTIRAASVFHIEPAVAGTAVWRDPVTIRFVPASPLQPGTRYTVSIDARLEAADGSRIAALSSFVFRVFGPRLLERSVGAYGADTLAPDGRVQLLYSAPIDIARLERGARLELTGCPRAGVVALRARQRPLRADDPPRFHYFGGVPPDSFTARFRTVVELEPVTTLPVECPAKIVIPTTDDESSIGKEERYSLHTVAVPRALRFGCRFGWDCGDKMLELEFASPMRRADIVRFVRLNGQPVSIEGQAQLEKRWVFRVDLVPRTTYAVAIDSVVRDAYDRPLTGARRFTAVTGDFGSRVLHALGIITVPRSGAPTFPLRSMNVRSVKVIGYRVPDSARVTFMSMAAGAYDPGQFLRGLTAETTLVELRDRLNVDTTTDVPLPAMALAPDHAMVFVQAIVAERLPDAYTTKDYESGHLIPLPAPDRGAPWRPPYTLVQVTDLAATARLAAAADGAAFVTGLNDGQPRGNVRVTQIDPFGRVIARGTSNAEGIATLARVALDSVATPRTPVTPYTPPRFTVLQAESPNDRVIVSLGGRAGYQAGSPLTLESLGTRLDDSPLAAGALFFDRDIFRPGEMLHMKGVVRRGMLGTLTVPEPTDTVRLVIRRQRYTWADDSTLVVRDTVMRLSSFGTVVDSVRLREGLRFHDGTPVLARDAVAIIRHFAGRDAFGKSLMAVTNKFTATDDRTLRFRLTKPFPHLLAALAGSSTTMPCIMPERLANSDPFRQVTEMVGSGPYRFLPAEFNAGVRSAYERFTSYVPRGEGTQSYTAGPKLAHFDRVEWQSIGDPATSVAALLQGEVDWLDSPSADQVPPALGSEGVL
jgi:hypothetical protein